MKNPKDLVIDAAFECLLKEGKKDLNHPDVLIRAFWHHIDDYGFERTVSLVKEIAENIY